MRRFGMRRLLTAAVLLLGCWFWISGRQEALTGDEIVRKVNETFNQESGFAKARMTIVTTSGSLRTFVYESWSKNKGEKNLVRYLEPGRVKGQATLMLNHADDIWMFFPRTQRVRKLASHAKKQKMQGSDFSYEDMGSGDAFVEDYTAQRLEDEEKEGQDCFKLDLRRKPDSDTAYSRLELWVLKDNFVPLIIDYYENNDPERLLKSLVQSDIREVDGVPTAFKVVMFNRNDGTKTEIELLEARYNLPLEDSMFTERALKK
jgi:outer membrane lipoprotein-sorting protein